MTASQGTAALGPPLDGAGTAVVAGPAQDGTLAGTPSFGTPGDGAARDDDLIAFEGVPWDPTPWWGPSTPGFDQPSTGREHTSSQSGPSPSLPPPAAPPTRAQPTSGSTRAAPRGPERGATASQRPRSAPDQAGDAGGRPAASDIEPFALAVREQVARAHASALRTQTALQELLLRGLAGTSPVTSPAPSAGTAGARPTTPRADPGPRAPVGPSGDGGPRRRASAAGTGSGQEPGTHGAAPRASAPTPRPAVEATARPAPGGRLFDVVDGALWPAGSPAAPRIAAPSTPRPGAFKPLARSRRASLDQAALGLLAAGEIAEVFGPGYAQPGCAPSPRLTAGGPATLLAVEELDARGGPAGQGRLRASVRLAPSLAADDPRAEAAGHLAAGLRAAELMALYLGLHLCFDGADFAPGWAPGTWHGQVRTQRPAEGTGPAETGRLTDSPRPAEETHGPADGAGSSNGAGQATGSRGTGAAGRAGNAELTLVVTAVDLVPRPWLTADVVIAGSGGGLARITDLTLSVRERPGAPIGPQRGGAVGFLGRFNAAGEPAVLSEFSMANIAHGDQGIGMGPEFSRYSNRRASRLPSGDLLLLDRVMAISGRRGELSGAATWTTEYDSPADAWYYRDSANASMPNCVYMECSLQASVLLGAYLGAALSAADVDFSLRNLGGSATVLREVDLRETTARQHTTLRSTSITSGSILQDFDYTVSVDGEPYYRGESMFGFFTAQTLANQTGLDAGRTVPTWLERQHPRPPVRVIDIAARRADPGASPRCSTGQLALLDTVDVVDGGGLAGLGYLHVVRPVDPEEWYFTNHFHLDPVVPGSIGVEMVIHALQEWLVDAGYAEDLDAPEFVVPVGATLRWKYRGQVLRTEGPVTIEVHITAVERRGGRVRAVAEASLWKPGLRIYALDGVCVELREPGARPW